MYEKQTEPLIEYYKKSKMAFVTVDDIDINTPIEEISQKILDGLKRIKLF